MTRKQISALLCLAFICSTAKAGAQSEYEKGVALYKQKKFAAAARVFTEALRHEPNNASAYYYLANCYHACKQDDDARKLLTAITQRFPRAPEAQTAALALKQINQSATTASGAASPSTKAQSGASSASKTTPADPAKEPKATAAVASAPTAEDAEDSDSEEAGLPQQASFRFTKGQSGHMMVDCFINGHPIKAMFDTGASAFFNKPDLQAAGIDVSKAQPAGFTSGWAGHRIPVWSMLADVRLGNLTRRLPIEIQDQTDGVTTALIGQDFISGYQYEIDDGAKRVDLRRGQQEKNPHYDALYDIPCEHGEQNDYVSIELNGKKTKAFIDTGAFATIVDPRTASQLGVEPSGETTSGTGVGGAFTLQVAYVNLRCGPIRRDNFRIFIGGTAGTAIGQDFMQGWRCKVDREQHLLRFFH